MKEKYQKLRDHIAQLKKQNTVNYSETHSHVQYEAETAIAEDQRLDNYETEIDDLLKQLSNYQEIIAQQEEVIKVGVVYVSWGGEERCYLLYWFLLERNGSWH